MKNMKKLAALLFTSYLLTGCTSTVMTGASAAYDRYSISQSIEDRDISRTANNDIYNKITFNKPANIAIATRKGDVLLAGQVPSKKIRAAVSQLVARVGGVKKVYNFLEVKPAASVHTHLKDSWITTKIKSSYLTNKKIDPTGIKVTTEGGVVFLMGNVTPEMATEAVKVASNTKGVHEVVKIFQYIHLTPTPLDKKDTTT